MMTVKSFFQNSTDLYTCVLKKICHIKQQFMLEWNETTQKYIGGFNSFANELNSLIEELDLIDVPDYYHDNEDILAEFVRDRLGWNIYKVGRFWKWNDNDENKSDYYAIIEQGGWYDAEQKNLLEAVAGRIKAAQHFGQTNFNEMEEGHKVMLGYILATILYHRL